MSTSPGWQQHGPQASLDRVRRALEGSGSSLRRDGTQWAARCPIPSHDDPHPSFRVRWVDGHRGGMTLLHCHGCKAHNEDLAAALGLTVADLFDEPLPPRVQPAPGMRVGRSPQQRRAGQRRGRLGRLPQPITVRTHEPEQEREHAWVAVETYPYVDADGRLVQEVVREECSACEPRHKAFRQVFVTGAGRRVRRKPPGFEPVLYRLPRVLQATADGEPVWVLEGEKDVGTAERLGLVATTNTQGGLAFPDQLAGVLAGADVRVVLDRDDAGWGRGVHLHRLLGEAAAPFRLYLPATSTAKSDLTDHVEAGLGVGDLLEVHVSEVAAWSDLALVRRKHDDVVQACAEVDAHLELAAQGKSRREIDVVAEHTRLAKRWALESQLRWEAMRELVDLVHGHVLRTGTPWAVEALDAAEEALRRASTTARTAHEATGMPVPPGLQRPAGPVGNQSRGAPEPSLAGSAGGGAQPPRAHGPGAADEANEPGDPRWDRRPAREARSGALIDQPHYRMIDGQIVQAAFRRRCDRHTSSCNCSDVELVETLKLILDLDVQIAEMEYLEDPATIDVDAPELLGRESRSAARNTPPAPRELAAVLITYTDPLSGEDMQVRIPAEEYYRDGGWLESLPGPPQYDSRPAGLARLRDAIKAVSEGIRATVRFRSTGWRRDDDDRWMYVHAGGAIDRDGTRPAPVLLSGPLARYDLPDPSTDPVQLRDAFSTASGGWLQLLPARVAVPLLGHVYRSALGPNPWVLALIGSPGSYKTSLASLAMHHWGELWDRRRPASSMSGNGDTINALRIKLNAAKDALYWADDVAPTRDWAAAQKTLEEFARMVHNGEERGRSARDGQSVRDGTPPRASALITSEVMPRPGSGAQRLFVVPLQADEIEIEHLIMLDAAPSRRARAMLQASMLRWLAGDLEDIRARAIAEAGRYAENLRVDGQPVREAEALGNLWSGWVTMCEFLVEAGAISGEERDALLVRVEAGLTDAAAATVDPDLPSRTGARVRELLGHALRTGVAFVDDVRTGDAPAWPLGGRLGWRRIVVGSDDAGLPKYRYDARGIKLGYVLADPSVREGCAQLLVESTAVEQVLKAAGAAMADGLQIDRGTALRALYDEGVLIAEERTGRTPRYTVQRTLHCEDGRRQRMTALRLAELLGDDDPGDGLPFEGNPDTAGDPPPQRPPLPGLFDPVVDDPQHVWLSSASPPEGLTSPDDHEEPAMVICTDADGVSAPMVALSRDRLSPCIACGQIAGQTLLGFPMHSVCWMESTADSRAAAVASSLTTPPAAPVQTPPPVAAAPAPQAPAAPADRVAAPQRAGGRVAPATFTAPAAVLDVDGVWLGDATMVALPHPVTHVGHIAALVGYLGLGTQVTQRRSEPGQIWVTAAMLTTLGIPHEQLPEDPSKRGSAIKELTKGSTLVQDAMTDGWQLGGSGDSLGAWTRVWRGEERGVWVALIPAMDPQLPVLADKPAPAVLARRLELFAGALRAPWSLSPAATGIDLMITLRGKDRDRLFTPIEPVPPAAQPTLEQDLSWSRTPTSAEQECRFVHAYDRGGSYAAGVAGLELGIGEPVHHPEGRPFDAKLPGYWLFEVPPAADWRFPHPLNPRGDRMPVRPVWATTPTLQLAYEQGYEVPILEAYVWPEHGRILDPWYERVRDARTALDIDDVDAQAARDLVKIVYTRTIGMMGSEEWMRGRVGYAPDRRHHIVAKARSNILRRVLQIGRDMDRWPVAATLDTLLYVSDDPDPVQAWPGKPAQLGRGFGQFKAEASGLLVDQLPYLTGQEYRGKDKLVRDWDLSAVETGT